MKRGLSGLSFVVGVDKPLGMTSHDVVNRCRRIFDERRIGHAGTLDPLASGVLLLCVGTATRLTPFFTHHNKRYRFRVVFGVSTDTDDAEGRVLRTGAIPDEVYDPFFAQSFVAKLVGEQRQLPPVYSAVKVEGQRSYEAARKGKIIDIKPRDICIHSAVLHEINEGGIGEYPFWEVEVDVSKGTYIRALARDMGSALGCPAHVGALQRVQSGLLTLDECVSLQVLEDKKEEEAIDPLPLLGYRLIFANESEAAAVKDGKPLNPQKHTLFTFHKHESSSAFCSCTTGTHESGGPLALHETIAVVAENKLIGLYQYDQATSLLKPQRVFAVGVSRGNSIG